MKHFGWGAPMNALVITSKTYFMERVVQNMVGNKTKLLGIIVFALNRKHGKGVTCDVGVVGIGGRTIAVAANKRVAKLVCSKAAAEFVVSFAIADNKADWHF